MPPCSAGRDASSPPGGPSLAVPGALNLMKSVSSPAIPSIQDENTHNTQGVSQQIEAVTRTMPDARVSVTTSSDSVVLRPSPEKTSASPQSTRHRASTDAAILSLNHDNADGDQQKSPVKEEKKRKGSVFAKFGSYRQKKLVKENKWKSTHVFMSISFSNMVPCDVCDRCLASKAALQCQNCQVKVHNGSCQDQIAPCPKFKHTKLPPNDRNREKMAKFQSSSLPGANNTLKSSVSMKERSRATSVPSRAFQSSNSTSHLPRTTSPSGVNGAASASSGYFQWRRVASKLGIDKVLNEEKEKEQEKEMETLQAPSAFDSTNITDTLSVSMESLEEGVMDMQDLDDDPDLIPLEQEAEAWSVTVDKKIVFLSKPNGSTRPHSPAVVATALLNWIKPRVPAVP